MRFLFLSLLLAAMVTAAPAHAQVCFGTEQGCPPITNAVSGSGSTAPKFVLVGGVSQTVVGTGSLYKVSFTTVLTSSTASFGNYWNTSTSVFTPLEAGTYKITAQVMVRGLTNATAQQMFMNFRVNGSDVNECDWVTTATANLDTFTCGYVIPFNGSTDSMDVRFGNTFAQGARFGSQASWNTLFIEKM